MDVADFDFELPDDRIAQHPVEPRDAARLLVRDLESEHAEHALVRDLPRFLRRGDVLVVNDTRVRPARLCGRRRSGGVVEMLVIGPVAGGAAGSFRALVRPAGRLRKGEEILLEDGAVLARALERPVLDDGAPGQEWHVELSDPTQPSRSLEEILERSGRMPLPTYIRRSRAEDPERDVDRQRYQTVFAARSGAVAAPTAGLHFTPRLLDELASLGVERASVTLHVGLGTFQPVTVDRVEDHRMHAEEFELPQATVDAIERARARGGRVVAVGTTSVRVLESVWVEHQRLKACRGSTSIFITPGFEFGVVDVLLTNFHLPRSTLLMLVSAFAGRERVLSLYAEALRSGYRFFSYGDAMLLSRTGSR